MRNKDRRRTNLGLARVSDALADHLPCFLKLSKFVVFVVQEIGLLVPFVLPRKPLTDMSTVLRMHILIRVDMCPMTSA